MMTDKGFTHALARAILDTDPENEEALRLLQQPKNRAIVNGVTYDLDKVSELQLTEDWVASELAKMTVLSN